MNNEAYWKISDALSILRSTATAVQSAGLAEEHEAAVKALEHLLDRAGTTRKETAP